MTDGRGEQSREELARLMEQYGSRLLRMSALYLRDAALEGRMGCKIGTVAFYVVLAALIVLAIVHFVG